VNVVDVVRAEGLESQEDTRSRPPGGTG